MRPWAPRKNTTCERRVSRVVLCKRKRVLVGKWWWEIFSFVGTRWGSDCNRWPALCLMSRTLRTADLHPWPWSAARRLPAPWQSDHPLNLWWTPSWTRAPRPCSFFQGCGESAPRSRGRWLCWLQWQRVQKEPSENLIAPLVLIDYDKHSIVIAFII